MLNENQKLLKSRLNVSFISYSLVFAGSAVISVAFTIIYLLLTSLFSSLNFGIDAFQFLEFYVGFVLPQSVFSVSMVIVAIFIPVFSKVKISDCVKSDKVPLRYLFPCIFTFLGFAVIVPEAVFFLFDLLSEAGLAVPEYELMLPAPSTNFDIVVLFVVLSVFPAVCEELIFRGFGFKVLEPFGKVGTVVVTSIAFGLFHGNPQQSIFAFFIGLFLGYVRIRFNSLILTMVLHFLNNFITCVFTVLPLYVDYETYTRAYFCFNIFIISVALASALIFIILTIHDKKNKDLCGENVHEGISVDDSSSKTPFVPSVLRSGAFWVFVCLCLLSTVMNSLLTNIS